MPACSRDTPSCQHTDTGANQLIWFVTHRMDFLTTVVHLRSTRIQRFAIDYHLCFISILTSLVISSWCLLVVEFQMTKILEEVAVGERIAYWIRTPQVPGSRPGWYCTFYWASDYWPPWQHQVERSLVCVGGRGRISRSGLTQDIKMGSCVFQCDVPHRWIAQRQVGPVSVYCDGVGCRVLCLRHGISVWQHIGQSATATSRHRRDMTSDVSKRL